MTTPIFDELLHELDMPWLLRKPEKRQVEPKRPATKPTPKEPVAAGR